jgi:hypothetical protein
MNEELESGESSLIDQEYLADLATAADRQRHFQERLDVLAADRSLDGAASFAAFKALQKEYDDSLKALGERAVALDAIVLASSPLRREIPQTRQAVDRGYRLNYLKQSLKSWDSLRSSTEYLDARDDPRNAAVIRDLRTQIERLENELKK